MKSLLASKRSKAILGIGVLAIGIGAISKKSYQLSNRRMHERRYRNDLPFG